MRPLAHPRPWGSGPWKKFEVLGSSACPRPQRFIRFHQAPSKSATELAAKRFRGLSGQEETLRLQWKLQWLAWARPKASKLNLMDLRSEALGGLGPAQNLRAQMNLNLKLVILIHVLGSDSEPTAPLHLIRIRLSARPPGTLGSASPPTSPRLWLASFNGH